MPRRIWVVPDNDLEARTIQQLLAKAGEEMLVTSQPWGASWLKLEPDIQGRLRTSSPGTVIYGVELAGPNDFGGIDIDHHVYAGDDRRNPRTSLEQVAEVLGVSLDRRQQLVAANDGGYFGGMESVGASEDEMAAIRRADREAQGITPGQEREAEEEVAGAEWLPGGWVRVRVRHPTSAHMDRLFPRARAVLLEGDGQWVYSGPGARKLMGLAGAGSWSGGSDESGYFGVNRPEAALQAAIREWFFGAARADAAS